MATEPDEPSTRKRPGRRPGSNQTREAILGAARTRFATDGYASSTIRKIAADAGVDSSLVMQFFGSKEELFGEVMSITPESLSQFADVFVGPEEMIGERLARTFLDIWEGDPRVSEPLLAMLRAAISNEKAKSQLQEFLAARINEMPAALRFDEHETALRIGLASSMLVGLMVGRRIIQVPILAEEDTETLVRILAPALQAMLEHRPQVDQ